MNNNKMCNTPIKTRMKPTPKTMKNNNTNILTKTQEEYHDANIQVYIKISKNIKKNIS